MSDEPVDNSVDRTVQQEIDDLRMERQHVLLLGAGASLAALPGGDRNGMVLPLLRDVAIDLGLVDFFPAELRELAVTDFEAAYSKLVQQDDSAVGDLNELIGDYFTRLCLPGEPNLYDYLQLCLRGKDAIFTFNWDPLLLQSRVRLEREGLNSDQLPELFFLHGNVAVGTCAKDHITGLVNRGAIRGRPCSECGHPLTPSQLLFPVESKNYTTDPFIADQWNAARHYLSNCFMFTIFGYSAPKTDVEAIELLRKAWGTVEERRLEQTEIIGRRGCDHDALRNTWDPFIHTHHYEILESFFDSWMANHPRRTGEAFISQYFDVQFIDNNTVPRDVGSLAELVQWFEPLLSAERLAHPEPGP